MSFGGCPIQEITSADFIRQLLDVERTGPQVPLMGSMDWTCRCNLRCRHCFVRHPAGARDELTTVQAKHVLGNLADHGLLFFVITGGEPMLRPDFRELYRHAKSLGFVLTIFTNATLVDDDMAAFLAANPPRRLEVTIYGHTEKTYETVTGIPGSFRRFRDGVDALLDNKLLVRFKTMVMECNKHEFRDMKAWAEERGAAFRYDAVLHGRLNGDLSSTLQRIPPDEAARLQFSRAADKSEFLRHQEEIGRRLPPKTRLFECGAGTMTLHVDTRGQAHVCVLWRHDPYDLLSNPLDDRFLRHVQNVRNRPPPAGQCSVCEDRELCSYCPPIADLETGHPAKPSPYFCRLAAERKRQSRS